MTLPLRLLLVEDSSDDAQLIVRTIQRGGYDVEYERVDTQASLQAALDFEKWDLIVCDFSLPSFNAIRALEMLKASGKDLPFIIVSGSITEEMAVTALRSGAHDFMVKGNMARLVPAIQRELKDAESRRQKRQVEATLWERDELFRLVLDAAPASIILVDAEGKVQLANAGTEKMFGFRIPELIGQPVEMLMPENLGKQHERERQHYTAHHPTTRRMDARPALTAVKKGGREFPVEIGLTPFQTAQGQSILALIVDISERKQSEAALKEAEARYRLLVERIPAITYIVSAEPPYQTIYISPQVEQLLGFSPEEWRADPELWERQIHPADRERVLAEDEASRLEHRPFKSEYRVLTRDGRTLWLHDETFHIDEPGLAPFSQGIEFDITERKHAEEALRGAEARYRILIEQLPMIAYVNAAESMSDTLYISPQIESILGYTVDEWLEDPKFWQKLIHPDDKVAVLSKMEEVGLTGQLFNADYRVRARDGRYVWIHDQAVLVLDDVGRKLHWQGLMSDITARKRREQELEAIARISQALRETQTMDEILPRLLDETLSLMDSDEGSIWLRDPVKNQMRLAAQRNWGEEPLSAYPPGQNIPDIVVNTGQTIVVRDLHDDPRIPEEHRAHIAPGTGGASVPLAAAGKTFGALFVNVRLPREITADELRVLHALADLGASAIHRAQLFEETLKHLDRLAALRSIDMAISSSFDLRMILNVVLEKVTKELGVDAANILLLAPDSFTLEFAASKGFRSRAGESMPLALGEGLPGRLIVERGLIFIEDLRSVSIDIKRGYLLTEEKFISYYGVPLVAKGKIKGVLEIFHRSHLAHDAEWLQFLEALAGQTAIAIDSSSTFQDLQRSNMDLALAYDATIEGWSHALDLRDKETEGHTLRVTEAALTLARALGMQDEALIHVRRGGLLHDIGKMGVPDSVLLKPGKLTDEEWVLMRKHPQFAYDMLSPIAYLRPALDIPYCHHEKWDGTGYPRGLKGEQIPLVARAFALVDVWDALSSNRPYRPAWKTDEVIRHLQEESGTHFDPAVTEVFLNLIASHVINSSSF